MMKKLGAAIAAIALLAGFSLPALAQSTNSGAMAGAQSGAYNGGNVNNFNGAPVPGIAPPVYAPAMGAGISNCLLPGSGGLSKEGFGISFGFTAKDTKCRAEDLARLFFTVAHDMSDPMAKYAAWVVLCRNFKDIQDVPELCGPTAFAYWQQVARPAPQQAAMVPAQTASAQPATTAQSARPRYCDNMASDLLLRKRYAKECGFRKTDPDYPGRS